MDETELLCRKIAQNFALKSIHLSELTPLKKEVSKVLVDFEIGFWTPSTIEGEQHFMRIRPYYIDYIEELKLEEAKAKQVKQEKK